MLTVGTQYRRLPDDLPTIYRQSMLTAVDAVDQKDRYPVTSFSWTCGRAELRRGRLVFARGATEEPSEASITNALWLRIVECRRNAPGFRVFAGLYGFLRKEGERAREWIELAELLDRIARPWGNPKEWGNAGDRKILELPSPGPSTGAVFHDARRHAQELWRQAVADDLTPDLAAPARFTPKNLAGFIALQVVEALEAPPTYRRCRLCGGWFAANRTDAFYCQDKHRSLHHYRERRQQHGTH
jgi:hypothetical protein